MKLIFILFLILFSYSISEDPIRKKGEDIIKWTDSYRLKWTDYNLVKYSVGNGAACSDVKIKYQILKYKSVDSLDVYIYSCFNKKTSWVLTQHDDSLGLEHERHHFDICEIYARELRKEASKMKFYTDDFMNLYRDVLKKENKEQDLYDKETNYAINKIKQVEWDQKIDTQLKEWNSFSRTHVIVKINK